MKNKMMKSMTTVIAALLLTASFAGCGNDQFVQEEGEGQQTGGEEEPGAENPETAQTAKPSYEQITQQAAKELMDNDETALILDVRTEEEYASGHIPDAVLIPHDEIADRAEEELTDKDQLILVYCRSGNRSKAASESLAELGYTNIREFGGINTWPYEIVTK